MLGSLKAAKGWLHRPFASVPTSAGVVTSATSCVSSSLALVIERGEIDIGKVRPPLGFVCTTANEQRQAYKLLRDHGHRVVLKPTDGLGCKGLVLGATSADLAPAGAGPIAPCIVEEYVGATDGPSPTVYMCGERVLAIADQLMVGGANEGNVIPCTAAAELQAAMAQAGAAIGRHLGLTSHWGMDFVIDTSNGTETPILVDLNMGRPNGSMANYLWRSLQAPPAHMAPAHLKVATELHQYALERKAPPGETVLDLVSLLRANGLLWSAGCIEGILPSSHITNGRAKVLCMSWRGAGACRALAARLFSVDLAGVYGVQRMLAPAEPLAAPAEQMVSPSEPVVVHSSPHASPCDSREACISNWDERPPWVAHGDRRACYMADVPSPSPGPSSLLASTSPVAPYVASGGGGGGEPATDALDARLSWPEEDLFATLASYQDQIDVIVQQQGELLMLMASKLEGGGSKPPY